MTHRITEVEDGSHAIVGEDGRITDVRDPDTGQMSVAAGFESASEARKAAEDSGLDVKSSTAGKSTPASKKSTASKSKARKN